MTGLSWKRNLEETLERRRRFFNRQMLDGILVTLPVRLDTEAAWSGFEQKWGRYEEGQARPFPSNEETFERSAIGLEQRGQVEDDWLPVVYSTLDAGESMVGAMFGKPVRFIHRQRNAAFSKAETALRDYSGLDSLSFSLEGQWTRRFLSIQDHFERHADGRFAQHPCLTIDALNFAVELRQATRAYLDLYEHPDQLRALMELGLDFNIRFQQAQMQRIPGYAGGCFVWLGGWVPLPSAMSLSVDAYVICSVRHYVEFGFEYQRRLIQHFGCGLMHFHCNRTDLAAEVAKLPGLALFQYGGDTRDPVPEIDRLPEMRRAAAGVPLQVSCSLREFRSRLAERRLPGNVWYTIGGELLDVDEANRLAEKARAYRA